MLDVYGAFVPELKLNPGKWARLATYRSKSAAAGPARQLNKAHPDCEFVSRIVGSESALYGRAKAAS